MKMNILKQIFRYIFFIIFGFITYSYLVILALSWFNPPITAFIQQTDDFSFNSMFLEQDKLQKWVPIKSISKNVLFAVIAAEDQRFFEHSGIDFVEIEKAVVEKIDSNNNRGASTITQQVAKNLFLFPAKSFLRKGVELYYALMIELIWDKKRILEVYLNVAQFGENIFGIEAASIYYFNKSSLYLNLEESAQLISILPNPTKFILEKKSSYLENRIEKIILETQKINKGKILEIVN